ncbi:hypothetical protein [Mesorhizobium sp. M6A.T.Ce.TU.016.01.1.1]|uniref:hypothetical protein n=1 Tax=Mesorhizobium sp. M6A.T.Ce.TU.016.01.1.1 TaxID=2496783 RepID=UPI000FCC1C43|nr:hypothetical protein [Mesorhizobium sp. M6A.T.Ce.TU.016.01.1.1]RUU27508.1 hypothetical protein EOC94_21780 [Mesorhizobium sp. M6A.T.Ce.TU.016.01.1.1]
MSLFFWGFVSLVLAIYLAVKGVMSKSLTPLQRAFVLFGAAALSVPGFFTIYFLFVVAILMHDSPF